MRERKSKKLVIDLEDHADEFEALEAMAKEDDRPTNSFTKRLLLEAIITKLKSLVKK